MKLLDLLVQELPRRGGWPDNVACACQSVVDSEIYFYPDLYRDGEVAAGYADPYASFYPENHQRALRNGLCYVYVTKEQYEAAVNG